MGAEGVRNLQGQQFLQGVQFLQGLMGRADEGGEGRRP